MHAGVFVDTRSLPPLCALYPAPLHALRRMYCTVSMYSFAVRSAPSKNRIGQTYVACQWPRLTGRVELSFTARSAREMVSGWGGYRRRAPAIPNYSFVVVHHLGHGSALVAHRLAVAGARHAEHFGG
jgi:hypothetical protein